MTEPDLEQLMTLQAIADRWLVSVKTVDRLTKRGALFRIKVGRQIRIRRQDVLAYEKSGGRNV